MIFSLVEEYYEEDVEVEEVDIDVLKERASRRFPKQEDYILHVLDNLRQVSVQNVSKDFIEMRKESLHQDLASAFMSGNEPEIRDKLQEYQDFTSTVSLHEQDDSVFISEDIDVLLDMTSAENLYKVYPNALNERLGGGIPKPCHLLIYARPEMGKSATCINLAAGFVNHGHKVLYVCNEDNSRSMLLRFYTRLSGKTVPEIRSDPQEARAIVEARGYDNLVFAGLAPGSLQEIESLVEEHKPDCVIVDQLHNLSHKNDNKVERLALLANSMRAMSNKHNFIAVSVTQAGDSADGKLLLGLGDVDYSNTGIPGAVDVMVGVGADENTESQGFRFMSLPKNKIGGGDHNPVKVRIEPQYSRITSV